MAEHVNGFFGQHNQQVAFELAVLQGEIDLDQQDVTPGQFFRTQNFFQRAVVGEDRRRGKGDLRRQLFGDAVEAGAGQDIADVQPQAAERCKKLGAMAFIKKPVNTQKVTEILQEYGIL